MPERLGGVDPLVALQPYERQVEDSAIASASAVFAGLALEQQRTLMRNARNVTVASASSQR